MSAFNGIHTLADGIISQVEICNNENCFGVGDRRLGGFCWECWQQIEMENNMKIFRNVENCFITNVGDGKSAAVRLSFNNHKITDIVIFEREFSYEEVQNLIYRLQYALELPARDADDELAYQDADRMEA